MNRTSPQIVMRAMNTLVSWCRNAGVKVLERRANVVVVEGGGGGSCCVNLTFDGSEPGMYSIGVKELTHRKLSVGLKAFAELLMALGHSPISPVNRGPVLDKKLSNGEDSELAAFRHTEFRRVPNPSDEKLESYQWLINQASKEFFSRQQWRCQDHMLEIDDLKTYAAVWVTNFIGLYERTDLPQVENDKLCHSYLIQRFNEFRIILSKKERNEFPTWEDVGIAIYGTPSVERPMGTGKSGRQGCKIQVVDMVRSPEAEASEDVGEDLDDDARREIAEGAAVRRDSISEELSGRLQELGHDKMVETLTFVVAGYRFHPDARREAEKRLERHREECKPCAAAATPEAPLEELAGEAVAEAVAE